MALVTYADLEAQVANWLARDDLTANIPDFITLFEAEALGRLNVRLQETTASITTTSGVGALPTDFVSLIRLTWQGNPVVDLRYVHPSVIQTDYPTSPSGTPVVYTFEAGNVKIRPVDDTGLQIVYRQKTPAVSGTLNWLWTNYPNAYLFGSLAEAQGFNVDPDKMAMWIARRDAAFEAIQGRDFRERGPMAMRVMGASMGGTP